MKYATHWTTACLSWAIALTLGREVNAGSNLTETSPNEAYVMQCAALGIRADLCGATGRRIDGGFLSRLPLRAHARVHPHGLQITNAVIQGLLDWGNMDIPFEVQFDACVFEGPVNFSRSRFHRSLTLRNCVFQMPVYFRGTQVDDNLETDNSTFLDEAIFSAGRILGQWNGQGDHFMKAVSFEEMKVGLSVNFCGARLALLDLQTSRVLTADQIKECVLTHANARAPTAITNAELFLVKEFPPDDERPLREYEWLLLRKGPVPEHYQAWLRCFGGTNYSLAVYRRTVFNDRVELKGVSVGGDFLAQDALFAEAVHFDCMRVGQNLDLDGAVFMGAASLGYISVTDNLSARGALFTNDARVNLYGMKVGVLDLQEAEIRGPLILENTEIAHALSAQGVKFTGSSNMADFYGLKVGGSAYFDGATFTGPVNFILAHIAGNFEARGARFDNDSNDANLAAATRHQPLHFNTDFGSMKVDGFAILSKASFAGQISFRNATFQHLHLDASCGQSLHHTNSIGDLRLEGLSYRRIRSVTNETAELTTEQLKQSWESLRELLRNHTPYSFDIYQNLEEYFQREGQAGLADEVYIEGRCRERTETLKPSLRALQQAPFDFFPWLWNWLLYQTVRYGREPERALLYSLIIVLVGCLVFNKNAMAVKDGENEEQTSASGSTKYNYSRVWFSLDLFLPLIGLWDGELWVPQKDRRWVWRYMRLHKILGWILVPIALAAFSGIIK